VEKAGDTMERGVIHISPGEGRTLRVWGEMVTYKTTSDQTGGAYSLFEVVSRPGTGPPPHVQHREDEAFWVLSGEYEFLIEGRTTRTSAGSLIYIPRGNLHAHKNVGEEPGRMLVTHTPGGLHERFFEEVGELTTNSPTLPVSEEELDAKAVVRIAAQYGIEMIPPASAGEIDGKEMR
jgi:mannose-6-phosphate isomerase-like protein (cupin superfamily)